MELRYNNNPSLLCASNFLNPQNNLGINDENQIDFSNQQWIETGQILPQLPFMYLLNRNHIVVNGLDPSVIAKNIRECLRKLSITVIFNKDNYIAHAVTNHNLRFDIRLFTSSNNKKEPRIIVEINRMSPSQFGYSKIMNAIFQSAMGKPCELPDNKNTLTSFRWRTALMQSNGSESMEQTGIDSLNNIGKMVNKDRYDSNSLGIESLVCLTNNQITFEKIALFVANFILYGNGNDFAQLQYKIYNLIIWGSLDTRTSFDYDYDSFVKNYNLKMRSDALRVFLNSLETIFSSSKGREDLSTTIWFGDEFIDGFLNNLEYVTSIPHGAHDAHIMVQCLELIISNSLEFRCKIKDRKKILENVVNHAIYTGSNCHELLATESKKLMAMVQNL